MPLGKRWKVLCASLFLSSKGKDPEAAVAADSLLALWPCACAFVPLYSTVEGAPDVRRQPGETHISWVVFFKKQNKTIFRPLPQPQGVKVSWRQGTRTP